MMSGGAACCTHLGLVGHALPDEAWLEAELGPLNLLEQRRLVLVVEGRGAAEQDVEDDTDRPHVHGLAVPLATEDLGGDVPGAGRERGEKGG